MISLRQVASRTALYLFDEKTDRTLVDEIWLLHDPFFCDEVPTPEQVAYLRSKFGQSATIKEVSSWGRLPDHFFESVPLGLAISSLDKDGENNNKLEAHAWLRKVPVVVLGQEAGTLRKNYRAHQAKLDSQDWREVERAKDSLEAAIKNANVHISAASDPRPKKPLNESSWRRDLKQRVKKVVELIPAYNEQLATYLREHETLPRVRYFFSDVMYAHTEPVTMIADIADMSLINIAQIWTREGFSNELYLTADGQVMQYDSSDERSIRCAFSNDAVSFFFKKDYSNAAIDRHHKTHIVGAPDPSSIKHFCGSDACKQNYREFTVHWAREEAPLVAMRQEFEAAQYSILLDRRVTPEQLPFVREQVKRKSIERIAKIFGVKPSSLHGMFDR